MKADVPLSIVAPPVAEWALVPLGELTESFDAQRMPVREADRRRGPYPYYGASGVVDYVDDFIFDGEYLLIAEDGENLNSRKTPIAFLATGQFWVNNHAHIVRGNQRGRTRFLAYVVEHSDVAGYLTGGVMPKLTKANLQRLLVPCPSLAEQDGVVSILGALDDKIALNRRMNRTLEATAAALFRSWFVDFDPVVAKADGRRALIVSESAHATMPQRLVDGDGDTRPDTWESAQIGDFVSIVKRGVSPGDAPALFFDHYSIPAFDEGALPAHEDGASIKSGKFRVEAAGVLLSKLNPRTPRVWWPAPPVHDGSVCSTEFMVCVPRRGVPREYVYALFRSESFADAFALLVTGTSNSHQRVKPDDFLRLPVLRPLEAPMRAFADVAGPMLARTRANVLESAALARLRDALLPQLLSGALRLRDAERAVAGAV